MSETEPTNFTSDTSSPSSKEDKSFSVNLTSNPTVLELVEKVSLSDIDSQKLKELLGNSRRFRTERYDEAHIPGMLFELHIRLLFEQLAKRDGRIDLDPLKLPRHTSKFIINRDLLLGGVQVYRKERYRIMQYAEFDDLISVDGLPVIIEAKMSSANNNGNNLRPLLRSKRINACALPIQEAFSTQEFGYVVFSSQEAIASIEANQLMRYFTNAGGIVQPISTSYDEFARQTNQLHNQLLTESLRKIT